MDIRTVRRSHNQWTWIHLGRTDRSGFEAVVYVDREDRDVRIHIDTDYGSVDEARDGLEVLQRAVEIAERERRKLETPSEELAEEVG